MAPEKGVPLPHFCPGPRRKLFHPSIQYDIRILSFSQENFVVVGDFKAAGPAMMILIKVRAALLFQRNIQQNQICQVFGLLFFAPREVKKGEDGEVHVSLLLSRQG